MSGEEQKKMTKTPEFPLLALYSVRHSLNSAALASFPPVVIPYKLCVCVCVCVNSECPSLESSDGVYVVFVSALTRGGQGPQTLYLDLFLPSRLTRSPPGSHSWLCVWYRGSLVQ